MDFLADPTLSGFWITIGAAACVVILLGNYRRFVIERKWLRQLKAFLVPHRESVQTFWENVSTGKVIPIKALAFGRVDVVRFLEQSGVEVDTDTLSAIAVEKEESLRVNAISNYLVSIFLIVGLCGTFLALKDLLNNSPLKNVAASGQMDPRNVQMGIDAIYRDFGRAFYSSIAGIAATIGLLALRAVLVNPERNKFFSELDHLTQLDLIPLFRKEQRERNTEAYIYDTSRNLNEAAEKAISLTRELTEYTKAAGATAEKLNGLAGTLEITLDGVQGLVGGDSAIQKMLSELRDFGRASDERHHELADNIVKAVAKTADQGEVLGRLATAAEEKTEKLIALTQRASDLQSETEERFRAFAVKEKERLDSVLNKSASGMSQSLTALSNTISSLPKPATKSELTAALTVVIDPVLRRVEKLTRRRSAKDDRGASELASEPWLSRVWGKAKELLWFRR